VIDHLNIVAGKSFKKDLHGFISARLAEGYTVDDCMRVIDTKAKDPHFQKDNRRYMNVETLFRPGNFERYVNEVTRGVKTGVVFAKMPLEQLKPYLNKHWRAAGYDLDWHLDMILPKLQAYYDAGGFTI
jgi:uncharacterized phage protein (TIGR02220 family)